MSGDTDESPEEGDDPAGGADPDAGDGPEGGADPAPGDDTVGEDDPDTGAQSPSETGRRQRYAVVVLAAVAAVVVGAAFGAVLFGVTTSADTGDGPDGTVAVVTIEGPIAEPIGANLEKELRDIRADDSIDAVVLEMNTPGGSPAPTERMYMSIKRTSEEMPVLASVQTLSASAGYYMMMPAEEIYVLPTSLTGSVGVNAGAPQATPPIRGPSGPDKAGSHPTEDWAQLDTLQNVFLETVIEERGDRLELPREEVAKADVYTGVEAVENGYADEIGSLGDAIDEAADRAGLDDYTVEKRQIAGLSNIPIIAKTDHGLVAIHDENPSLADVQVIRYAMVYEPAIPHIDTLEAVAGPDVEQLIKAMNETEAESEGDRP
ncbi:S49 family peptidase [Halobacteriales archaeon QH_2_65_14]|nr:MAG: S49 family peptidase [Halobacteriales archaeon QH_2_65_14]